MLQKAKAIFLSKKQLTHNVYEFTFLCKDPKTIEYFPGQYVILNVPDKNGNIKRLYSVFNFENKKDEFKIAVKIIPNGKGSSYLMALKEQENVDFEGPTGVFLLNKNNKDKIFLATGTGIMPILSLIFSNIKDVEKFTLFWGLRQKSDIFYFDLLQQIAKNNNNFTFGIFISREEIKNEPYLYSGHIDIGLEKLFIEKKSDIENTEFYICGNKMNVDSVRNYLIKKGIKTENIKTEKFG
jgi:ferredoxin-NADP reductase